MLLVGAAIAAHDQGARQRANALAAAGVDVIVIDERNGDSDEQLALVAWLRAEVRARVSLVRCALFGVHRGFVRRRWYLVFAERFFWAREDVL